MSIEVRPLDAWDDAEFAEAYAVLVEAETHGRPHAQVDEARVIRSSLVRPSATVIVQGWMARVDGRAAGVLLVAWPLLDDAQVCWPMLAVAPAARRRGVGSALCAVLMRAVRSAGRSVIQAEVSHPADVDVWPGTAFAERHGFRLAMREAHCVLRLPVPPDRLDVAAGHGYELRAWRDSCPGDLVDGYCRMRERFEGEAPTGDLLVGPQRWDEARVRDTEQRRLAQGRSSWTTVALSPGGEMVGFTELVAVVTGREANQNQTLVLPEHRGHRIGAAMKAANLRRMSADLPGIELVHTNVAPDNDAMNRVNRELGFEPVELLDEWQLVLEPR